MGIIGEAFVAVRPETAGFGADTEGKLRAALGAIPAGAIFAGLAIGAGAAAFSIGEAFEDSYRKISKATGATGDDLHALEGDFKTVLAAGPDSMGKVADAIGLVSIRTKLAGGDLDALTESELKLARVTGGDVKNIVDETTQVFANWGIQGIGPSKLALDELLKVSEDTGISVDTLSTSIIGKAGAVFREFHVDIGAAASIMGTLQSAGVSAQPVIMGLNKAFVEASKQGKDAKSFLGDLFDTLQNGVEGTDAYNEAIKTLGSRGFASLSDAVKSGKLSIADFTGSMDGAAGQVDRVADANLSLGEKFDILKNKALVALEPIGMKTVELATVFVDNLEPAIGTVVGGIEDFVEGFRDGTDALGSSQTQMAQWGAVAFGWVSKVRDGIQDLVDGFRIGHGEVDEWGRLLATVGADARTVYDLFAEWGDWLNDHRPVLIAFGAAIALIVAPVPAIIAGLALLYAKFEPFRALVNSLGASVADFARFFEDRWDRIRVAVVNVFNILKIAFAVFLAVTIGPFVFAWQHFNDQILAVFRFAWSQITLVLSSAVRVIGDIWSFFIDLLSGHWGDAWQDIADIPLAMLDYLKGSLGNLLTFIVDFFSSLPANLLSAVGDIGAAMLPIAESLITGLVKGLASAVVAVFTWFFNLHRLVIDKLAGIGLWLVDSGINLVKGLFKGIVDHWEEVATWLASIPFIIIGLLIEADIWLVKTGVNILEGLLSGMVSGAEDVWSFFTGLPGRILGFIGDAVPWLLDKGKDVIHGLWNGFLAEQAWFGQQILQIPGWVIDGIIALVAADQWLVSLGVDVIHGLWDGVSSMESWIAKQLLAIPGWVTGALSDAGSWLHDAAVDVIVGFWHGLESMKDWLWDKITGFFGDMVDHVKSILHISSPSQVFFGLGSNVGEGFAHGLESMQDRVTEAHRTMLAGVDLSHFPDVLGQFASRNRAGTGPIPGGFGPPANAAGFGAMSQLLAATNYTNALLREQTQVIRETAPVVVVPKAGRPSPKQRIRPLVDAQTRSPR